MLRIRTLFSFFALFGLLLGLSVSTLQATVEHDENTGMEIDGDSKADLTIYRPTFSPNDIFSLWAITTSTSDNTATLQYQWGLQGDVPVSGNFTSTQGSDLTVWRPASGVWFIRKFSNDLQFNQASAYQWGLDGDIPVACDFNGDGLTDLAVWRPASGTWFVRNSNQANPGQSFSTAFVQQWGLPGDVPIPGDFDTDGKCDYVVYRNGLWYVLLSSTNNATAGTIAWGAAGDVPVPGFYDNDSIMDFAVYRENTASGPLWLIRHSTLAGLTSRTIQWGLPGDIPVPLDYDGDGKTDIVVYRPASQVWFIRTSSSNYNNAVAVKFGVNSSDIPVGTRRGASPWVP